MSREYSKKQIQRYRRQKYISSLNKCTKNLYKMFKDKKVGFSTFKGRFKRLKEEIELYSDVYLQGDHFKKTKEYIDRLYLEVENRELNNKEFLEFKEREITNLNRLQKIKNQLKYSKKYRSRDGEFD